MILWHVGTTLVVLWFVFRGNTRLDYRLLAIGSLLPDLIDKPIGRIFLRGTFDTGHLWGHTLLLNVLAFSLLFFMRGKRKRKIVLLPIGSLMHLAEDAMWSNPQVFWWPLFGWAFPREPASIGLFTYFLPWRNPATFFGELAGLALLAWLLAAHKMLNRAGIREFLRTGHLEPALKSPKGS